VPLEKGQDDLAAVHRAPGGPERFHGTPEQRAVPEPGIGLAAVADHDARFQQSQDGLDVSDIDAEARPLLTASCEFAIQVKMQLQQSENYGAIVVGLGGPCRHPRAGGFRCQGNRVAFAA
jgi:hypothetical protein